MRPWPPAYGSADLVAIPPRSGFPGPEASGMTLYDAATVIGGHVWTERRLFEVLGSGVAALPDAAAKGLVDRHAAHAAWRAKEWWDRLPVLAVVDRPTLVAPPTAGIAAAYDLLGGLAGDVAFLAGIYRVALPRLIVAYRRHGARTAPAADGAVRRTIERVAPDLESDRAEGEEWLQSLLVDVPSVDGAAAAVAAAERLLAEG